MKTTARVLGIIGGVFALLLALKWSSDLSSAKEMAGSNANSMKAALAGYENVKPAMYELFAAGPLALLCGVFVSRFPRTAGVGFLLSASLTTIIVVSAEPRVVFLTAFIGVAGVLALVAKRTAAVSAPAAPALDPAPIT
jgi:hypothetical protein